MTASPIASSRGPHATHSAIPQPFCPYGEAYSFGAQQSHFIPVPSPYGRDGSSFASNVLPSDMVNSESLMGVKPGDSGVVIRYQVDEFNDSCWQSVSLLYHINPGFMGKGST